MSRLVYLVFLLAVAKASRNTLQQKTEVDAGKPKLAGIIVKASRKTLPQNTKVDAKKESKLEGIIYILIHTYGLHHFIHIFLSKLTVNL